MKPYRMIWIWMMPVLSLALLAGCAGGLLPQKTGNSTVTNTNGAQLKDQTTGMEFVLVKGGCFPMGDAFGDGNNDEKPVHEVCVSDFYLGRYEVTQSQWESVMGSNPSSNKPCGPDCPVDSVSWDMVQEYIRTMNAKSGKQYRLPTEAEWEYAARSGVKADKWAGTNNEADLGEFAWYERNSKLMTHPVGLKKANGLGLFDMSGNVGEWCQDWYDAAYYSASPKDNPPGAASGEKRVLRGGSWVYDGGAVRTAKRSSDAPAEWDSNYGFRLVSPAQ